jgi:hypothetical protein
MLQVTQIAPITMINVSGRQGGGYDQTIFSCYVTFATTGPTGSEGVDPDAKPRHFGDVMLNEKLLSHKTKHNRTE